MQRFALVVPVLLVLSTAASAAQMVPVTTCGQVIPKHAVGYLTADLDCTGFTGGHLGMDVEVGRNATFDLGGFTVTGGGFGAACVEPCGDGHICTSRCTIKNGTLRDAVNSEIYGDNVTLDHVNVLNSGFNGVDAGRRAKITNSTISGHPRAGVFGGDIILRGSTVTGNGRVGIGMTDPRARARVVDSTLIDNDTDPTCNPDPAAPGCYDLGSSRRPKVKNTTCGRSHRSPAPAIGLCRGWCVCTDDQP